MLNIQYPMSNFEIGYCLTWKLDIRYSKFLSLSIRLNAIVERYFKLIAQFTIGVVIEYIKSIAKLFHRSIIKRTEQAIPQREDIAVVGIGLWSYVVMVHFMHIGRYNYQAYGFIQPKG